MHKSSSWLDVSSWHLVSGRKSGRCVGKMNKFCHCNQVSSQVTGAVNGHMAKSQMTVSNSRPHRYRKNKLLPT